MNKPPFTKSQITQANNINLIQFAKLHGYILENGGRRALHAKQSGGLYFFRDSNKYYHFSTDSRGGPIDFVMQFMRMDFKEAVAYLLGTDLPQHQSAPILPKPSGKLQLPDKAPNYRRISWYLIHVRGIEPEIVFRLMREKKLYQQDMTGNCVFVGYDQDGSAKYCSLRGTWANRPFKQDRPFSDKSYPFHIAGTSRKVYVCESPIDAMSHATLLKLDGQDWKVDHRISLGCLSDQALERFLRHHDIKKIIFCLDNDVNATFQDSSPAPNWGQEAAFKFAAKYACLGYATSVETPVSKDVNEDLCTRRYIIEEERKRSVQEDMLGR
ncbi:DUF3991 and TOPRIM domain-containing protein [Paenibacillus macerans]|uniref:DUF3991 domain-containing protein n=1 Tax=Paenibacillus macerans TaxID=44252 RepID=A0A090ZNI3_PAEMA|nr:DUF3991 and TOPRIM domain-containing protein [Paenibacillus macerans]KFN12147.1 hypothetical protein DJ90_2005 [Paenibacillus macerans]MCY7558499.1 DUF3991 and toprim domain-containing protein [Paenibacillus macerans]MEC0150265.1 DUF3991 and TOPRIM domain-containing protein [Paenibacillus macerans]SUA84390.1 DNA primase (bacterial type) [Paenibacillus macerans]